MNGKFIALLVAIALVSGLAGFAGTREYYRYKRDKQIEELFLEFTHHDTMHSPNH